MAASTVAITTCIHITYSTDINNIEPAQSIQLRIYPTHHRGGRDYTTSYYIHTTAGKSSYIYYLVCIYCVYDTCADHS